MSMCVKKTYQKALTIKGGKYPK